MADPADPAALLAEAPVQAAVTALADRNAEHFEAMTEAERADALAHWRELAVAVLTAAASAFGATEPAGPGRAVIVLEDAGPDEVAVHATFHPQLEEHEGQVEVTPAQATALELLDSITGDQPS